jgi:hypothetical protein
LELLAIAQEPSLWADINSDPSWPNGVIIQWGGPGDASYFDFYYKPYSDFGNTSNIFWDGGNAGGGVETMPSELTGSWYSIVLTYDGTTPEFYLNGVLQTNSYETSNLNLIDTTDTQLEISGDVTVGSTGRGIDGVLSDIRIYNYALTSNDVSTLYNSESVPEPSTHALFGLGALALVIACRRRKVA